MISSPRYRNALTPQQIEARAAARQVWLDLKAEAARIANEKLRADCRRKVEAQDRIAAKEWSGQGVSTCWKTAQ